MLVTGNHLSELTEGQIDRDDARVNAMIAVLEAEAVTSAPDLRGDFRSSRR